MSAKYIEIHPENPQKNKINNVVHIIKSGGVAILPTDSVYTFACDINNSKAIEKIRRLKEVKANKLNMSFICYDLSDLSLYAKVVDKNVFRSMKKALPGPYTFILNTSSKFPKIFEKKKSQVGIRIPDCNIIREVVAALGNPIMVSSVKEDGDDFEYDTDPYMIYEKYQHLVDVVVDGGSGNHTASTVVDATEGGIEVIREGLGDISIF